MIKRVYVSEIDRHNLSKHKTTEAEERDIFDYKNIVVKKPWGYEYLMFENDFVAIWILHLKKDHATSIHCHPRKKTSLVVLSGNVLSSTLSEWFDLKVLDGLIFENGVFHTSKALSNDVFIMEVETPPNKKDLVRLKDSYGREGKSYEGKNKMTRELHKFKHIFIEENDVLKSEKKILNKVLLQIKCCKSNLLNTEISKTKKKKIYTMLEEKIIDSNHKKTFGVGDVFTIEHLAEYNNIKMFNNSLLFSAEQI